MKIEDYERVQKLADEIDPKRLHRKLDWIARTYYPVIRHFESGIHWRLM